METMRFLILIILIFPNFALAILKFDLDVCKLKTISLLCKCGETGGHLRIEEIRCPIFTPLRKYCPSCSDKPKEELCSVFKYCGQCDAKRRVCTSCPFNRFGLNCNFDCSCKNGGHCDKRGKCICPESFKGDSCEISRDPPGICPRLPHSIHHGTLELYGDKGGDLVTPGAALTFKCERGFVLRGATAVVCMTNGKWSAPLPECAPESIMCQIVEPIRGATVVITYRGEKSNNIIMEEEQAADRLLGPFEAGTQLIYKCESKFYTLIGSSNRTCLLDGNWSGNPPTCLQECGHSSVPRVPHLSNGIISEIGQWPWQVAMYIWDSFEEEWKFWCGGSLINDRWILTAAHCVKLKSRILDLDEARWYFGKHYRDISDDDPMVEMREAKEILINPNYNPVTFDSDMALVRVNPLRLTSRVLPVCLPSYDDIDLRVFKGNIGTVTGWGIKEDGSLSSKLRYVEVPIVPLRECREAYKKIGISISKDMICAGYKDGRRDVCAGDSGGPLVFPGLTNDQWVLEGIVSWGSPFGCGKEEQYGGFSRVQSFVPWIKSIIEH